MLAGLHQYSLLYSPFNLNQLNKDEVLFFEHGSGRQLYAMKLETLKNRPKPDIVITGNHVMRNFEGTDYLENFDLFNFVIGGPSINQELDLLKALKNIGRLPNKILIYTILAHGGSDWMLKRHQVMFSDGKVNPPYSFGYKTIRDEMEWFFRFDTYLNALFSIYKKELVVNYPICAKASADAKKLKMSNWLSIRLKIAEYLPPYASIKSGLLDRTEFCKTVGNFRTLNVHGQIRNGGQIAKFVSELIYHRVYDYPILTPSEANAKAVEAMEEIQKLEEFANENGFRMVYLIPPRYEIPLNGPNDEVANLIFENNPKLTVIDFRRFSLEKKYYIDDAHLSEEFGLILGPCLNKILNSKSSLPHRPAINLRGRSVC